MLRASINRTPESLAGFEAPIGDGALDRLPADAEHLSGFVELGRRAARAPAGRGRLPSLAFCPYPKFYASARLILLDPEEFPATCCPLSGLRSQGRLIVNERGACGEMPAHRGVRLRPRGPKSPLERHRPAALRLSEKPSSPAARHLAAALREFCIGHDTTAANRRMSAIRRRAPEIAMLLDRGVRPSAGPGRARSP